MAIVLYSLASRTSVKEKHSFSGYLGKVRICFLLNEVHKHFSVLLQLTVPMKLYQN